MNLYHANTRKGEPNWICVLIFIAVYEHIFIHLHCCILFIASSNHHTRLSFIRCEIWNYLFIADWWKEISMIIMRVSPPISHHHSCLFCLAYEGVAMMIDVFLAPLHQMDAGPWMAHAYSIVGFLCRNNYIFNSIIVYPKYTHVSDICHSNLGESWNLGIVWGETHKYLCM